MPDTINHPPHYTSGTDEGERELIMEAPPNQKEKRLFRDLLLYAADCIQYYERIASLPDCNSCSHAENECMYLPKWGEPVRINCPHWNSGGKE